jgi:hypothetical protein
LTLSEVATFIHLSKSKLVPPCTEVLESTLADKTYSHFHVVYTTYSWAWAAQPSTDDPVRPGPKIPGRAGLGLHFGPGSGLIFEPERRTGAARTCSLCDLGKVRARLVGPGRAFATLGRVRARFIGTTVGPGRVRA